MNYLLTGILTAGIIVIAIVIIVIVVAIVIIYNDFNTGSDSTDAAPGRKTESVRRKPRILLPHEAAGEMGERAADRIIRSVLSEEDVLFSNVNVSYDGRDTELDNVVVNKYGVFIIEVKYYSGRLTGSEDDYEWTKTHVSGGGNVYVKTVKNPIKQVKREIYILAKYLDYYGLRVWVDGYAMILGADSPVDSDYMLLNKSDIDRVIHTPGRQRLNAATVERTKSLMSTPP